MVISGTKGYAYVPAPWWKTDYFEIRYEDQNQNKKFFYPYAGEGLRYEIKDFVTAILQKTVFFPKYQRGRISTWHKSKRRIYLKVNYLCYNPWNASLKGLKIPLSLTRILSPCCILRFKKDWIKDWSLRHPGCLWMKSGEGQLAVFYWSLILKKQKNYSEPG